MARVFSSVRWRRCSYIEIDPRQGVEVAGVEQGGFDVGHPEETPLGVGHTLDELALEVIAVGEAVEEDLAVLSVLLGIFFRQEGVFRRQTMAEGIAAGASLSFAGDGSGGELGVGLVCG